jgi:hypothetical protein
MIKTNARFLPFLHALRSESAGSLSPELKEICDQGFVCKGAAFVLKFLADEKVNFTAQDLIDLTGYECLMNKVHVNDFAKSNLHRQTFQFVEKMHRKWIATYPAETLHSIISINEGEIVVRFHSRRAGQKYLNDDLDLFLEEGVLEADSQDTDFFKFCLNGSGP